MPHFSKPYSALAALSLSAVCLFGLHSPPAQAVVGESLLHVFTGGSDGGQPGFGLAKGPDDIFYGSTASGGAAGNGVLYSIDLKGNFKVLHTFGDGSVQNDGFNPYAAPIVGSDGTIYGTTERGGIDNFGTIYKLTPSGSFSILHSFKGGGDGGVSNNSLSFGNDGKLYGNTNGILGFGLETFGTIFSLNTDGSGYITQYRFDGSNFGAMGLYPSSALTKASATSNVMYGTTFFGGDGDDGEAGVVYAFTPSKTQGGGSVKVLHNFDDGSVPNDGENPNLDTLLVDSAGNIYGDTQTNGPDETGGGTVYKLTPNGVETILHIFTPGNLAPEGSTPAGGVIFGRDGNLYGVTMAGGQFGTSSGFGCIYSISPNGKNYNPTVYQFKGIEGNRDGFIPNGPLVLDNDGNLVGTTAFGGNYSFGISYGTIFHFGFATTPSLKSVVLSTNTVRGGFAPITGNRVYWSGNAPADEVIKLTSDNPAAASVPASVVIAAGSSSHLFTITTKAVTTPQSATITATFNGVSKSATISVTP